MKNKNEAENYIVEFITVGHSIKVTVIDPETLTEVSIVGSTKTSQQELTEVAVRKLHYVINKNRKK